MGSISFLAGATSAGVVGTALPPLWRPIASAASSDHSPVRPGFNAGVRFIKRVPALTARLTSIVVGAMLQGVLHVFFLGSPRKIMKPVIFPVAVKVPSNKTLRTRSDECFKDGPVDENRSDAVVFGWINRQVSIFADCRFKDSFANGADAIVSGCSSSNRLDTSVTRDFVESLESDYWTPLFDTIGHVSSFSAGLILGAFAAPARFQFYRSRVTCPA